MGVASRVVRERGPYSVIYADLPLAYRDKATSGKRGSGFKYVTMRDQDILDLGPLVRRVTLPDAWLFLWATAPRIEFCLEVVRAWGFDYRTIAFDWRKATKNGKLAWGMGNHTRANEEHVLLGVSGEFGKIGLEVIDDILEGRVEEHVLLGVRGRPKRVSASVHSAVTARAGKHSAKPHEVRRRIQRLVGDAPRKLELFARRPVEMLQGWDFTGLEYDGRDVGDFLAGVGAGRKMGSTRGGVMLRRR
jgi:N6-adenosine-specific RNA methylase IME4